MSHVKRSGCKVIFWGLESFSQSVLLAIKKKITEQDIWHTLKVSHEAGIENAVFTMIGNYKETVADLEYTYNKLKEAHAAGLIQYRQTTVCTGDARHATGKNDFTWKDPKAAERMGMAMIDYVIGGVDRGFKLKLFHALYAAEQAGLSPGITSAFRDDYRQSIASGLKAASDKSYHGGSFRGGYGHGLAADIVSVKGATRAERWVSTEALWKWIDARGSDFGIGRPYLDRDPPHVAPIDCKEYAAHRGGTKALHAEADIKKRNRGALQVAAKRSKTAKASKGRTI